MRCKKENGDEKDCKEKNSKKEKEITENSYRNG
jgi:hypothetical protein